MGCFQWISRAPLPSALDLTRRGWRRCEGQAERCARLIDARSLAGGPERYPPALRRHALVLGLHESAGRARWLAAGFADALGANVRLDELELKATRLLSTSAAATELEHGALKLDLIARDAWAGDRRLRLNPREFALLWRLAETQGKPVEREALLHDVFDLGFDPGTNRVAVHVCRLRKKLAMGGLGNLLTTRPSDGAYCLILPEAERGDGD
jgi:hypothetical protein